MKKLIGLLILCAVMSTMLSGCSTWDGLGRDVESLGRKMQ